MPYLPCLPPSMALLPATWTVAGLSGDLDDFGPCPADPSFLKPRDEAVLLKVDAGLVQEAGRQTAIARETRDAVGFNAFLLLPAGA